jgi:hypothetical protein
MFNDNTNRLSQGSLQNPQPQDDDFVFKLDKIEEQAQATRKDVFQTIAIERAKLQSVKSECDERTQVIKGLTCKFIDFLTDKKSACIQMIDEFDPNESLRAQSLGPVLPAREIRKEILCDKVEEFSLRNSKKFKGVTEN